jgi:hypothetical protein
MGNTQPVKTVGSETAIVLHCLYKILHFAYSLRVFIILWSNFKGQRHTMLLKIKIIWNCKFYIILISGGSLVEYIRRIPNIT